MSHLFGHILYSWRRRLERSTQKTWLTGKCTQLIYWYRESLGNKNYKVQFSNNFRLRLNYPAVSDILSGNSEELLRYQQEDLIHLGRVSFWNLINSKKKV